jgi:hypothetical protein
MSYSRNRHEYLNPLAYFSILLTKNTCLKHSSLEPHSCSAGQETPHLSWDLKVHFHVHRSLIVTQNAHINNYFRINSSNLSKVLLKYAVCFNPLTAMPWISEASACCRSLITHAILCCNLSILFF